MEDEKVHQELKAADDALKQGRYEAADKLLDLAAKGGAEPRHISDLGRRLRAAKALHEKRVRTSVRSGFCLALAGYVVLSLRQPAEWRVPVWLALIFLVIPGLVGVFVGRRHAGERTRARAFYDGARCGAYSMVCYSGVHVLVLANRLQKDASQTIDEYVAGVLTVVVFSAIAGMVAGSMSAMASLVAPKGESA